MIDTFEQDTDWTPVIFRMFDGDVIAIFVEEPGDHSPYTCASYMHVGQHGVCEPHLVINKTRLATPEEYADLKNELESAPYGYRLKVLKRYNPHHIVERNKKLREMSTNWS